MLRWLMSRAWNRAWRVSSGGPNPVRMAMQKPLFPWHRPEDSPSLTRCGGRRQSGPDDLLVWAAPAARGRTLGLLPEAHLCRVRNRRGLLSLRDPDNGVARATRACLLTSHHLPLTTHSPVLRGGPDDLLVWAAAAVRGRAGRLLPDAHLCRVRTAGPSCRFATRTTELSGPPGHACSALTTYPSPLTPHHSIALHSPVRRRLRSGPQKG